MKRKEYFLSIDQGTTATNALLFDHELKLIANADTEFTQYFPKSGWVEHDLEEIWLSTQKSIRKTLKISGISPKKISAIGITNQRETTCAWDLKTGKALARAIVWQDRRTTQDCKQWIKANEEKWIHQKTGLFLDPYFSASKMSWLIQNNGRVQKAIQNKNCALGTIDSYLLHRLTGGQSFATEMSNASRTLLFNLKTLKWDDELLRFFEIPRLALPECKSSAEIFGHTLDVPGLPDGIPISGILGDQQSALLGQGCVHPGEAKCTYGTGSFILMNTGSQPKFSHHRLLTTLAWNIHGKVQYALEGGSFTAGAAVQWIRDQLNWIRKSEDIEKLALKAKPESDPRNAVVFLPAFAGLGAPYWVPEARGAIFGLTRGTTPNEIARAVLEGIAFLNHDILKAMEKDALRPVSSLHVDGGGSQNNFLMQFQSNLLQTPLNRPRMIETTSLGAAIAAGLGIGFFKDLPELKKKISLSKTFKPRIKNQERHELIKNWNQKMGALVQAFRT